MSFFRPKFSFIRNEYGDFHWKSSYSSQIWKNVDNKKLRIGIFFTKSSPQKIVYVFLVSLFCKNRLNSEIREKLPHSLWIPSALANIETLNRLKLTDSLLLYVYSKNAERETSETLQTIQKTATFIQLYWSVCMLLLCHVRASESMYAL